MRKLIGMLSVSRLSEPMQRIFKYHATRNSGVTPDK